jgi:aldehyde dehydrogenase (NAD+)
MGRTMRDARQFYIDGQWVDPVETRAAPLVNPATEIAFDVCSMGGAADVDAAVRAARRASEKYACTTAAERSRLLGRILERFQVHFEAIAQAMTLEMGVPISFSREAQTAIGVGHLEAMIEVLGEFAFEQQRGATRLLMEPVGVCGLITPWNWPIAQVASKVVPALAAGCSMVLKPSEWAPLSAAVFTLVLHEAGVPPGVFNLVHGDGGGVGVPLSCHPAIDMVSFTGSTRAGIEVARNAAVTVKRVHQELGGKSPCVLLEDADCARALAHVVNLVFQNAGQSCDAPTRVLVPRDRLNEVESLVDGLVRTLVVGDPNSEKTMVGPVVSQRQFERIQGFIETGIGEGARLIVGGVGRPPGLERGYYVRPTVFSDVRNDMTIAREEIFGPVLSLLTYQDEEDAVRIANDTPYGLAAYVWGADDERASRVAERLRAGQVSLNGASPDMRTPFGGFKMSGNGREYGEFGLREFLEVKAVIRGTDP